MLHLLSLHEEFIKTYKKLMFKLMQKKSTNQTPLVAKLRLRLPPFGPKDARVSCSDRPRQVRGMAAKDEIALGQEVEKEMKSQTKIIAILKSSACIQIAFQR